ncbi:MAG: ParB/RepB/Spo0J family partition protein [Planctomycetales bacterium]|nr:ParB/RepB/Spo0J family partition protein [Planctomycetales bacterium]
MSKERRLGRGLAALLGDEAEVRVTHGQAGMALADDDSMAPHGLRAISPDDDDDHDDREPKDGDLLMLSVYEIEDNPYQPRRDFSESEIVSLAESLKEHDMLQPVLVRRWGDHWQLISGERRLRAAIHAGWTHVPARVREADDRLVAELAIVENLQRKDLNPIEKAMSFRRYIDEHQCTQDDLGKRLKIDRSTIANLLRLLELPSIVQSEIQSGDISAGHARAILPLGDEKAQIDFANRIKREGISVRETERIVQDIVHAEDGIGGPSRGGRKPNKKQQSPQIAALEQDLRMTLGTKVEIRTSSRNKGQIIVHFRNNDEFERLSQLMKDGAGQSSPQRHAS